MSPSARILSLIFTLLALAGCSYNPFVRNNQSGGSLTGTAIGAGIGAGTAALLEAPKPVVGLAGIIGGGIGYYTTSLRYASSGIIHAGGITYQIGCYVTIVISSDKLFDTNSDEFLPGIAPILNSIVAVIRRYPENNIMISGNTSGFGPQGYEQNLSEARARRLAAYLWSRGISGFSGTSLQLRRLIYVGYGNYFPIANSIRSTGIRANSRMQITLFPSGVSVKDRRYKVFSNVGGIDEPPLLAPRSPRDFNKIFPPGPPPGTVLHERSVSMSGQVPENYNRVFGYNTERSDAQMDPGCRVVKQGAGLPGEG